MALDMREFYEENSRSIWLTIILLTIMLGSIALFTYIDITDHDYYALPWGELCYTGNTNPDCINIEQLTNCPNGGDACIEARYAQTLIVEAVYIALIMTIVKVGISQGLLKFDFNSLRIYQTIVWAVSPIILLFSAWEDFLYYVVRLKPIPQDMNWLNNVGAFPYVMQYITRDQNAGPMDMFVIMAGGLLIVLLMWYFYIKFTNDEDKEIPI